MLCCVELGCVGLGWVGLGWVGLSWVELGWVGLGCVGLGCAVLFWVVLCCIELYCIALLHCIYLLINISSPLLATVTIFLYNMRGYEQDSNKNCNNSTGCVTKLTPPTQELRNDLVCFVLFLPAMNGVPV